MSTTQTIPTDLTMRLPVDLGVDMYLEAARGIASLALSRGFVGWWAPPDAIEIPIAAGDDHGVRYRLVLDPRATEVDVRLLVDRRPWTRGGSLSAAQLAGWFRTRAPGADIGDLARSDAVLLAPAMRRGRSRVPIGGVDLGAPVASTRDRTAARHECRWYSLEGAARVWRVDGRGTVDLFERGQRDQWIHWTFKNPGPGNPLRRFYHSLERSGWRNLAHLEPTDLVRLPEHWRDQPRSHVGQVIPLRALELLLPSGTPGEFVAELSAAVFGADGARVAAGDHITVAGVLVTVGSVDHGVVVKLFEGRLKGTIDSEGVCMFVLTG